MKTPIIAASSASMKNENSRTRFSIDSHEHRSAIGVRNVVRTTRQQADAVDADVIRDAEVRQPAVALDELIVGRRRVEVRTTARG